ncbi:MAG: IS1096 element passenger TnpR family protein [Flavobacteriales bacterium]
MIFKFRVILDSKEDIFRDIEILDSQSFESFHKGIYKAFGFDGQEMATFYISDDDWKQGEEIVQMDMGIPNSYVMNQTLIEDLADDVGDKFIYVYDLFNYWTFFVELVEVRENDHSRNYPKVITSVGKMLNEAPKKKFTSTSIEENFDLEEEFDDDDDFSSFDNIDDLDL